VNHAPGGDPVGALLSTVRRRVLLRSVLRATAVTLLGVCALITLLLLTDLAVQLSATARRGLRWLPALLVLPAPALVARSWARLSSARLALLVDERGDFGNVTSTMRHPNADGPVAEAFRRRALHALGSFDAARVVPLDVGKVWATAVAAAVLALGTLTAAGGTDALVQRWWHASPLAPSARFLAPLISAPDESVPTLGDVTFNVRAPAYADLPDLRGVRGDVLTALPGSLVEIRGSGTAREPALRATIVGGGDLTPRSSDAGWVIEWLVGADERGLALTIGDGDRPLEQLVLPLRLLRDRPPTVQLTAPTEDIVLATATGQISIEALARDDYGVVDVTLHWVRSRGTALRGAHSCSRHSTSRRVTCCTFERQRGTATP